MRNRPRILAPQLISLSSRCAIQKVSHQINSCPIVLMGLARPDAVVRTAEYTSRGRSDMHTSTFYQCPSAARLVPTMRSSLLCVGAVVAAATASPVAEALPGHTAETVASATCESDPTGYVACREQRVDAAQYVTWPEHGPTLVLEARGESSAITNADLMRR